MDHISYKKIGSVPLICVFGCYLLMALVPIHLEAQDDKTRRVLSNNVRTDTLEDAEGILRAENPEFNARLESVDSPFAIKVIPVEPVEAQADDVPVPVTPGVAPPPRRPPSAIPDATILKSVADRLNPKGSLVTSRRSLLLFANGGRLTVGDSIPAKVRGKDYKIIVTSITPNDYTLTLNDAEITRSFKIISSKSSMTLDRDSN